MLINFVNPYSNIYVRTSTIQRVVLLHCMAYYEFDNPKISDKSFDELIMQLVEYQKKVIKKLRPNYGNDVPDESILSMYTDYGYATYDIDGTTGFDLVGRLLDKDKKHLTKIVSMWYNGK